MAVKTKSFADKIRKALADRKAKEMIHTQRWLALKIGMKQDKLSDRMNDVSDFTPQEIEKISKALNLPHS